VKYGIFFPIFHAMIHNYAAVSDRTFNCTKPKIHGDLMVMKIVWASNKVLKRGQRFMVPLSPTLFTRSSTHARARPLSASFLSLTLVSLFHMG
jgi:hypothetical protein